MKDVIIFWTTICVVNACLILAAYMLGLAHGEARCVKPASHFPPPVMQRQA